MICMDSITRIFGNLTTAYDGIGSMGSYFDGFSFGYAFIIIGIGVLIALAIKRVIV